jgi:hypothetical protein
MALVNHLKNREAQRKVLARAAGRHVVQGHLLWSYATGAEGTHIIYLRQALGEAVWTEAEGIFFKGLSIPASDYHFLDGTQTETTGWFDSDVPHHRTVICDVKCPEGVGDFDVESNPPVDFRGIFKCEKFPDFDDEGNQIVPSDYDGEGELSPGDTVITVEDLKAGTLLEEEYFTYSANPARVIAGWHFACCADAHPDDINWTVWVEFRDFHAQTEMVDYTSIDGFDGFGLTGTFYNGTNFETYLSSRIDPVIDFDSSTRAPAIGQEDGDYSVRWEGRILALYTETYEFKIIVDNGARFWVNGVQLINEWSDDGLYPPGTHTGTIALTAGQFYTIKVEWNDGGGEGEFHLKWSSDSQDEEIIPPEVLYPLPVEQALYEAHVDFSVPTTSDEMINRVLLVTNSIRQDVDGKMEFYCIEQLASSFHVREDLPERERQILRDVEGRDIFAISRSDRRVTELRNVWEALFRDLDSRYLEEPLSPVMLEIPELIAAAGNRKIYGEPVDLGNMTRWQARKVLAYIISREVLADVFIDFEGTARTYQMIAQDVVEVSHSLGDFVEKSFLVTEATDNSPEETADTRIFKLQEWLTLPQIFERVSLVSIAGGDV